MQIEIEAGLWCSSAVLVMPVLDMPCDGLAAIVVLAVVLAIVMPAIMPCHMFWWPFPPSSCIVVYRRAHRRARSRCHIVTV